MGVCVEDLSVVEDAFDWWKGRTNEEIYFVLHGIQFGVVIHELCFHSLFKRSNLLIDYIPANDVIF